MHRRDSGEQLTGGTANLEHTLAAWHVRGEDLTQAASIIAAGVRAPHRPADPVILNRPRAPPGLHPVRLDHQVSIIARPQLRMPTLAAPFAAADDPREPKRVKVVASTRLKI